MGAYKGPASTIKDAESKDETFKKGGKIAKKKEMKACGGASGKRADRPARKSGGAVFSSAASGTPRGKQSHY
jgi:hypothetical protein